MDPIVLAFYAIICGFLSLIAPNLGGMLPRVAIGAVVGIASAIALPWLRTALGF